MKKDLDPEKTSSNPCNKLGDGKRSMIFPENTEYRMGTVCSQAKICL